MRAYLPQNENATRHNKDVLATYFIGVKNCYDSAATGVPVLWNAGYADELVYPNPFVQETQIVFSVPQPDHLTLNVYNQQGTLVRRLIDGCLVPKGRYQIVWDGLDGTGTTPPGGVYLYSLHGELSGERTGKIVLVR